MFEHPYLVFHVIWGFVVLVLVYDAMLVMLPLRSLMLGLRSPVVCHYVSPLPMSDWKSIIAEMGYTEDVVENAWSINNGDFGKPTAWLLEHCVRDHSDESDEGDDMVDCYGDGVGFDDDDFDY